MWLLLARTASKPARQGEEEGPSKDLKVSANRMMLDVFEIQRQLLRE
jgi:hypothetical protein